MTFEEYKDFWMEKPEHYKTTEAEIKHWKIEQKLININYDF